MALRTAYSRVAVKWPIQQPLKVLSRTASELAFRADHQSDVGVAQLEAVSFSQLLRRDELELSKLLRACQKDGFFYLDLANGSKSQMLRDWKTMLPLMQRWFDQPISEKLKYHRGTVLHGLVRPT